MRRHKGGMVVVCAFCFGVPLSSSVQAQSFYRTIDITGEAIPSVGLDIGRMGINIHEEIAFTVNDEAHVWLPQDNYGLDGCELIPLPTPAGATESSAHDISDEGFVSGSVTVSGGAQHAFVWQLGSPITMTDLADETLFPRDEFIDLPTVAWSVNDAAIPWVTGVADGQWECNSFLIPTILGFRVLFQTGNQIQALEPAGDDFGTESFDVNDGAQFVGLSGCDNCLGPPGLLRSVRRRGPRGP